MAHCSVAAAARKRSSSCAACSAPHWCLQCCSATQLRCVQRNCRGASVSGLCEPAIARLVARCMAFGVQAWVLDSLASDRKRRGSRRPSLVAFLSSRPEDPDAGDRDKHTARAMNALARPAQDGRVAVPSSGSIGHRFCRRVLLEDYEKREGIEHSEG